MKKLEKLKLHDVQTLDIMQMKSIVGGSTGGLPITGVEVPYYYVGYAVNEDRTTMHRVEGFTHEYVQSWAGVWNALGWHTWIETVKQGHESTGSYPPWSNV